jgi:periplasmic protein CpxP/Spy
MNVIAKRLGLLTAATVLAVGVGGAYVFAQNTSGEPRPFAGRGFGPGGPMGPFGALPPMLMQRLNLTDAQREQVKSVMDSHRDEMKALGEKAGTAHKALQAAVTADQFDESAIRSRSAEAAALDADMAVLRARIHGEVWQLLTPDQQKTAKDLQTQMEQRRAQGGRRGPR